MITDDFSNIHMTGKEVFALRMMSFHLHIKCSETVIRLIANGYADYTQYIVDN